MKVEALLPCPFCGAVEGVVYSEQTHPSCGIARCSNCNATHACNTEVEAIQRWNRRATLSPASPPPAAPEKPDFDALASDALRSVEKGVGYKHYHACVKANLIAAYELGWTAARASAETEMADAKSDADNARSLAESRRLGKEQAERELAEAKHVQGSDIALMKLFADARRDRDNYKERGDKFKECLIEIEAKLDSVEAELATVKARYDRANQP